jgi:hypothetical protein
MAGAWTGKISLSLRNTQGVVGQAQIVLAWNCRFDMLVVSADAAAFMRQIWKIKLISVLQTKNMFKITVFYAL